jgi:hypothetical protein
MAESFLGRRSSPGSRQKRVVLSWRPHSLPEPPTELEVTFAARAGGTSVELEHRRWEGLSEEVPREPPRDLCSRWPFTPPMLRTGGRSRRCFALTGRCRKAYAVGPQGLEPCPPGLKDSGAVPVLTMEFAGRA